jgi:hypothetical protein
LERSEYPDWVSADGLSDGQKFNDIDPTFATFVFGNERLGPFEAHGEVVLG